MPVVPPRRVNSGRGRWAREDSAVVPHSCSMRSLFGLATALLMIGARPDPARAQQPPQPASREQQIKEFERQLEEMKKKLEELKGTGTPAPVAQTATELN